MEAQHGACPRCGLEIAADAQGRLPALCPHCGEMIVIGDEEDEQLAEEKSSDQELEGYKILQIVRERRALIRTRTYYMAAAIAALVGIVQAGTMLARELRTMGWSPRRLSYVGVILILAVIGRGMYGRMRRVGDQIKTRLLDEPTRPPNFDGLSDGSQRLRDLDDLARGEKG